MSSFQQALTFSHTSTDIDFSDITRTVKRRWRRIAIFAAITTLYALFAVLHSKPQFTLNGLIYLGNSQSAAPQSGSSGINFLADYANNNDVNTQIQLIESKALIEQAILETGLNATIVPAGQSAIPFWRWRLQYGEAIQAFAPKQTDLLAQFAVISDPGSRGAAYTLVFGQNGTYTLFSDSSWFTAAKQVGTGTLGQPASGGGVSLMISPAYAGMVPPKGAKYTLSVIPAKALADTLLGGPLVITAGGTITAPTKLASIKLLWSDPYKGKIFVDQLMKDFIATQLAWKTESASNTENFVSMQLQNIRASMAGADQKLADYQAKTGILDVPANAQSVIQQLSQYEVQRTTVSLQQQALSQLVKTINDPAAGVNPYLVSQANDPVLSQLAGNLATAQVQLSAQQVQYTGAAPEVQVQAATVGQLQRAIRSLIINDEALAQKNLTDLDDMISSYQDKLKAMPAESLQVIALTRSSDVLGQLYVLLMQKEEEAQVSKAATIVDTKVVTPSEVPLYATTPKSTLTVLAGLLFGLLAGTTVVLAQRAFSGRFQSDDEIRRAVPLRIYGLVPERPRLETERSVFPLGKRTPFSEAFRMLRSNLYQANTKQAPQVILLTSAALADGKTTVACNLAKMISEDGKRVVIIDADLHQGHLHETLGVKQAPGLTEWLATDTPSPLQILSDQNFAVLSAGCFPANPSELLNGPVMAKIIDTLRAEFDFIIVDCPPLPVVSDTLALTKYADLVLSVVYVERTSRRSFALHNESIGHSDRQHGVVINGVTTTIAKEGYGYYNSEPPPQNLIQGISKTVWDNMRGRS